MELKNIKMYSHLLADIARELGMKGQEAYRFAEREKANFSKMLKGERPLKYEFIIPLEKIFGVSLARLMNEDAYKLPVEKKNVAFDKGFRYYAFLDDPVLYEKEFDILLNIDGKTIRSSSSLSASISSIRGEPSGRTSPKVHSSPSSFSESGASRESVSL